MTAGLQELTRHELAAALEEVLLPRLLSYLRDRGPGHCMRVSDLDLELMERLCGRLRAEEKNAQVVILGNGKPRTQPELTVTSTKLVELRNPLPDGTQRPPLLVFIPNDLRASAEDSFGVATFESIEVSDIYQTLRTRLLSQVPNGLRMELETVLEQLAEVKGWRYANPLQQIRFLLTLKSNGFDKEAAGAALYELGLVPDFKLFEQPGAAPARIRRNQRCVSALTWSDKTERGRVLSLDLDVKRGRAFRKLLGEFLFLAGLEDPHDWTRRIVMSRENWKFSFDKWPFEDGGDEPESVLIADVATNLSVVPDDTKEPKLEPLIGQQVLVLGTGGTKKFNATFRVDPHPNRVQGLARFVAQVISREHGPVGLVRTKSVWKGNKLSANISFTGVQKAWAKAHGGKNSLDEEEAQAIEGWHFIRVLAQTQDGELIPLVDENGDPIPWSSGSESGLEKRPNESDLFYVIGEVEAPPEPPQRAVQREASLEHARLRLQFSAVVNNRDPAQVTASAVGWAVKRSRGTPAGAVELELRFGREGKFHVLVSKALKVLEQKILASPKGPLGWRLPVKMGQPEAATGESARWPTGEEASAFIVARTAWFDAIRDGQAELVTQAADLRALHPLAIEYADTYRALIQSLVRRAELSSEEDAQAILTELRRMLAVDTVTLVITDHRGRRREGALVAPTHPLRALWLSTWAEVGRRWVEAARKGPDEHVIACRDALMTQLSAVGFPAVLNTTAGRLMSAVDDLHPFWTLYAPANEVDPRGLLGDVAASLGLPEPAVGSARINGAALASRVRRYLVQHPYVRTLIINAFNAGRAGVLADMLLQLQKQIAFSDVRYDIRLFVPDAEAPGVGEALTDLLSPSASVTGKEADTFATATDNHLRPKLALAVKPIHEFRAAPDTQAAHLSFLFDVFPPEEIGAAKASEREVSAPVHGLIQDYQSIYDEDPTTVSWRRVPRHGQALPIEGAEELTDLLSNLPALLSEAVATVATGEAGVGLRPEISLALDAEERALLHQVHEVSDWVLTLDRNMGIEYFDHAKNTERPDYLIDHSADLGTGGGHQLVITSRSITELEALLVPVLESFGLTAEGRHAVAILEQLRSLSGRLALKLISAHTQRAEALGLALSRMFLEHQQCFKNQIVVPLDAHLELYRILKKQADELGEDISFKRTDLALFDLNAATRTITCRLVEVKCYQAVGDFSAYTQLKDHIAEQVQQSEKVLSTHFDPLRTTPDRPDRLLKTRELVSLLEFYLDRAVRYGLMSPEAETEARFMLRSLERGYQLEYTRSAVIFDFEKPGTGDVEVETGIEYHRVGIDLIQQLVDAAAPTPEERAASEARLSPEPTAAERSAAELERRREKTPSIPILTKAAFKAEPRERSVDWDELKEPWRDTKPAALEKTEKSTSAAPATPSVIAAPQPPTETANPSATPAPVEPPAPVATTPPPPPVVETSPTVSEPAIPDAPTTSKAVVSESETSLKYDVLLGASKPSPQFGLLGEYSGRKLAIDLNQTHTISLFGVQGGGKSYTLGTIVEMASLSIPNINTLPQPLATVIFHYSQTMDYKPEFTSMVSANTEEAQLATLRQRYGAEPKALSDVILLVPADKLEERRAEYPGVAVHPIQFAASELQASHWRFLMGAVGNQATYIRQLGRVMRSMRDNLTLEGIRQGIDQSRMPDNLKDLARMRLELAEEYIDDQTHLGGLVRPGRLLIVDLRDEYIEKDEALGLFLVLLQLFADATYEGRKFNKLVVFDEAHKYIDNPDLVEGLVSVVREMRHKGTSIMVASQDPPSVPVSLIELSSQIILHKFNSPAWLKHIKKANAALAGLTPERMAQLRPGEAYVWSSKATDDAFSSSAIKVRCRPRVTHHGGATKTATGD